MNISIHSDKSFLFLFLRYVLLSTPRNPELESMKSAKDSFRVGKSLNEDLCLKVSPDLSVSSYQCFNEAIHDPLKHRKHHFHGKLHTTFSSDMSDCHFQPNQKDDVGR